MKIALCIGSGVGLMALNFYLLVFPVHAAIPAVYTNENFWSSEHDQPVSFEQDALGNFSGVTLTGKVFTQTNVANGFDWRLQRFSIDEAFFYVSDRGIIVAANDLTAISIYLTRAS